MGLSKDANGWNIPTPTAGWQDGYRTGAPATNVTMIIFVSDLTGSDATSSTEGSKANPYKTIAKALTRTGGNGIRGGSPDWILLATGETWLNQKPPDYFGPGLNEQNRMIISSYDKTATISAPSNPPLANPYTGAIARPIIKTPGGDVWAVGMFHFNANTIIMGIDFYAYTRDTTVNPANASNVAPNGGLGIFFDRAPGNILIEDNVVRWYAVGITGDAYSNNCPMSLRRNIVVNNWGDKYGIGSWQMNPSFLVEENFLDMNGWDPIGQPAGGTLNHNWYVSGGNNLADIIALTDLTCRGNISTNCLYQDNNRCGGTYSNNLWQIGGTGGTNYGPNNPNIANLIENEVYIGGFLGGADHNQWASNALELAAPVFDNTYYFGKGVPGLHPININGCIFTQAGPTAAVGAMLIGGACDSTNTTVRNCISYKFATAVVNGSYTDGGGNFATVSPSQATTWGWPHPERTPPTYMTDVIHDGSTWADFTRRCRAQSKRNWNPLLMAESVNDYIREGFARPMVGSAYASGTGTILLNPLPASGVIGTAYSGSTAASGGVAPYTYAVTTGVLPNGLSLNTSTGAVSGTPSAAGVFNFNIRATDNTSASNTRAYTVTITGGTAITLGSLANGIQGTTYNGSVAATGGTAPYTYAVISGALPPGLSLNTSTGAVTGIPTTLGTSAFTIRATDATSASGTGAYSVVISAAPSLTLSPSTLANGTTGAAYSQTVTVSGGTPPYTFAITVGSLPPGLSLDTAAGVISGTPITAGVYSFTVRATQPSPLLIGSISYTVTIAAGVPVYHPARLQVG